MDFGFRSRHAVLERLEIESFDPIVGDRPVTEALGRARDLYRATLAENDDRDRRAGAFSDAELHYRQLAAIHAQHPDLLTDRGNAAPGNRDFGRAAPALRASQRVGVLLAPQAVGAAAPSVRGVRVRVGRAAAHAMAGQALRRAGGSPKEPP